MRLLRLVLKNALRNRRRTVLTALSVAVSLFLLVSLRTLVVEIKGDSLMTEQSTRRLITRSGVSLAVPLPLADRERLRRVPGVDVVSAYQWFPCFYKQPREPMIVIGADPDFAGTDPEYPTTSAADLAAFRADVSGVLIPVKMMQRFGWKVGDRVTFTGTIFPFNLDLTIRGTFTGPAQNAPVCQYRLINELLRRTMPSRADRTMAFILLTSHRPPAEIAREIDETFRNSDVPTRTESEKDFVLGFASMLGNVALLITFIAAAVVFAIVLVATNTMSMAVRERTHEIAVLKTLGFRPAQVVAMFVAESIVISGGGGIAGVVGAKLFFAVFDIYTMTHGMIQHFNIQAPTVVLALAVALTMSIVSAVVPAWRGAARPIAAGLREVA